MKYVKKCSSILILLLTVSSLLHSQQDLYFGKNKIHIVGSEVCSYTVNKNSHYNRHYLDIRDGEIHYTIVEYEQMVPVHIEITECKLEDLDKSSCSLALSDQKSSYTPGSIYILYLYTSRDQVSISTTIYPSPDQPSRVEKSSVGRIHFRDESKAQACFDTNFK